MSKRCFVDAKAFSNALKKASKVLKKSGIPILSEVYVQVKDGRCILTGTDLSAWLSVELPARGDDLAFVFSRTKDVERACRHFDGELLMEVTEIGEEKRRRLRLYMSCGVRAGEFDAHLPEDYPERAPVDAQSEFSVSASSLLERVERVRYATSKAGENARPTSISVQFRGSRIFALDGYRVACDTDDSVHFPQPFLADAEAMSYLKLFDSEQVTIQLGKRNIRIADGSMSLQFRTFENAEVYDLERAVPQVFAEEFYVSPREFLRELAYLKEFAPATGKPYVRFCGGELLLPALAGRYRTSIQVDGRSELAFAFDLRHVKDALQQFKNEPQVKVKVCSAVAPFVIEADGRGDFAMICPVRMKAEMAA